MVSANDGLMYKGLGLDAYVQATSPVRKFDDLAVHYQLKIFLRGDSLSFIGSGGDTICTYPSTIMWMFFTLALQVN